MVSLPTLPRIPGFRKMEKTNDYINFMQSIQTLYNILYKDYVHNLYVCTQSKKPVYMTPPYLYNLYANNNLYVCTQTLPTTTILLVLYKDYIIYPSSHFLFPENPYVHTQTLYKGGENGISF